MMCSVALSPHLFLFSCASNTSPSFFHITAHLNNRKKEGLKSEHLLASNLQSHHQTHLNQVSVIMNNQSRLSPHQSPSKIIISTNTEEKMMGERKFHNSGFLFILLLFLNINPKNAVLLPHQS